MLNLLIASLYKFTGTYFTVVLSHVRTHSVQIKNKTKNSCRNWQGDFQNK